MPDNKDNYTDMFSPIGPGQEPEYYYKPAETPSDKSVADPAECGEDTDFSEFFKSILEIGSSDTIFDGLKEFEFGDTRQLKRFDLLEYIKVGKDHTSLINDGVDLASAFSELTDDDPENDYGAFLDLLVTVCSINNMDSKDIFSGIRDVTVAIKNTVDNGDSITEILRFLRGTISFTKVICVKSESGAPYVLPLEFEKDVFSIAIDFYEDEEPIKGTLTLLIGTLINTGISYFIKKTLKTAFKSLMELIKSALNLTASPLAANPITTVAGLAVIALITALFAQAISKLLSDSFMQGGFPERGQAFIAREAGPELVGTIRGRNAVVNNNQIVAAVSNGVSRAFSSAVCGADSDEPIRVRLCIDGKQISMT